MQYLLWNCNSKRCQSFANGKTNLERNGSGFQPLQVDQAKLETGVRALKAYQLQAEHIGKAVF